jgi:hypothetical protein
LKSCSIVRCYQLVTLVMTPSNDPSYDKPSLLKGGISHILIDFDSLQFLFHCIFSNIGPYKPYIFRDHKGFISRNGYDAPSPPLPLFHIRLPKLTQDPTSCRLSNPIKGEVTSVFLHCTETSSPPPLDPYSEHCVDDQQIPVGIPFRHPIILSLSLSQVVMVSSRASKRLDMVSNFLLNCMLLFSQQCARLLLWFMTMNLFGGAHESGNLWKHKGA